MPAEIIFVHSDPALRTALATALAARGHDIAVFADPMTTLDALEGARRVELIITQVEFGPGKTHGIALARMARVKRPGVRALFIDNPELSRHVEGVGGFLAAPVDTAEIVTTAERMLEEQRQS